MCFSWNYDFILYSLYLVEIKAIGTDIYSNYSFAFDGIKMFRIIHWKNIISWNTPFMGTKGYSLSKIFKWFLQCGWKAFQCVLYSMVVWHFSFHYVHAYNVMYYECKNQRSKVSFIYTRSTRNSWKAMYSKQSYIANSICLELGRGFR